MARNFGGVIVATVVRAEAKITAQNALKPGINSAIGDLKRFKRAAGDMSSLRAAEGTLNRFGRAISGAVVGFGAYRAGGALKQAVVQYAELDRGLTRIGITAGATEEEIQAATSAMRALAMEAAVPMERVKEGLESLAAAGIPFREAMGMLPSIVKTAQASGAGVADVAKSTVAISRHLGITIGELQKAQDMLVAGGQVGEFEFKDMAQYLPTIAPALKAIGFEGTKGLARAAALLQVVRQGAGTSAEAATFFRNVIQKMESDETVNKFKKLGIDLRSEMASARKEGRDLFDTFIELSKKATGGDLSKINQIFTDSEAQNGLRALLQGMGQMPKFLDEISNSAGTVAKNNERLLGDTQAAIDRLSESYNRATSAVGGLIATLAAPVEGGGIASALSSIAENAEKSAALIRKYGFLGFLTDKGGERAAAQKDRWQPLYDAIDEAEKKPAEAGAVGGASYMPRDSEQAQSLSAELSGLERRISAIRSSSRNKEAADMLAAPLESQAQNIRNRIGAFKTEEQRWPSFMRDQAARANLPQPARVGPLTPAEQEMAREAARAGRRGAAIPVDMTPLDTAEKKVESVATAAAKPGQALAASIGQGVDQAITHVERLESKLRNLRMPSLGTMAGFPTGSGMAEVE